MTHKQQSFLPIFILITLGALLRVLRHYGWLDLPPNVAPVSAIAFLAAAYLPRRWGILAPLGLMVASDIAIGGYHWQVMVVVYASFALSYLIGRCLLGQLHAWRIGMAAALGATVFFLLTNAASWLWSGMYPATVSGLGAAYIAGLPFFRNMLLGDLGYSMVFFGIAEAAMVYWQRHRANVRMTNHG